MKISRLLPVILVLLILFSNCKKDDTPITDDPVIDSTENPTEEETPTPDETPPSDEETPPTTDISAELIANDLSAKPMKDIARPEYLQAIVDPSFGTVIRRISNGVDGKVIKPMYSTIQAWNADESLMILYEQGAGHQLLNGMDYRFIRYLDDINPDDLEQIFWDFNDPDVLFYVDGATADLTKYTVSTRSKEVIKNLKSLTSCADNVSSGNDVQMMSWNSDVIGFRCDNTEGYAYKISTDELISFSLNDVGYTAPMPAPSGGVFYHRTEVYNANGGISRQLNESGTEHSCLGKLVGGNDAHFAIAFAEGPLGGCIGNIIAHDLTTGECFPVISEAQGYQYSLSGTHISAVAHKNPGWIAASMMGFDQDGQSLLDQELVLVKVEKGNVDVYRIGHHRADEDEFDYWGEPHAVISPTGTRVLFGSDWSGEDDGKSVQSYVVELPAFRN